jgi:hypothetical protein
VREATLNVIYPETWGRRKWRDTKQSIPTLIRNKYYVPIFPLNCGESLYLDHALNLLVTLKRRRPHETSKERQRT